jgi:hypothetical protein
MNISSQEVQAATVVHFAGEMFEGDWLIHTTGVEMQSLALLAGMAARAALLACLVLSTLRDCNPALMAASSAGRQAAPVMLACPAWKCCSIPINDGS